MAELTLKDTSVRLTADMLADSRVIRMLIAVVATAPALEGGTAVVTSARDGTHGATSRHYLGLAVDVRSQGAGRVGAPIDESPATWVARLKQYLGRDYDVIEEVDHIHIEYDAGV